MSETPSLSILDFNAPRRPKSSAWRQLSAWNTTLCTIVQESWAGLLARPVTFQYIGVEPTQLRTGLASLPEDGLCVSLLVSDRLLPSCIVFSGRQVQGLLGGLLDVPGEDWPEARKLTPVEESMLEVLFQSLCDAIGDAWPGSEPLSCRFLETSAKPRRTRLFPSETALLVSRLSIRSQFGDETCYWLLPKEQMEELILDELGEGPPEERGPHPDLLALTERMPVEIVVELGKAELPMSQAALLTVGDVLMLDQPVHRPLTASVQEVPKWAGAPLRIGSRQAFAITHLLETGRGPSVALAESAASPQLESHHVR